MAFLLVLVAILITSVTATTEPTNVACSTINATALTLTWTQASDVSVLGYYVDIDRTDGLRVEYGLPSVFLSDKTYETYSFHGLGNYGTYTMTIRSSTASGNLTVYSVTCITSETVPNGAPFDFNCYGISISEIYCLWSDLPQVYWNGILTGYRITWYGFNQTWDTQISLTTTDLTYTISGLTMDTRYIILINGVTSTGNGIYSADVARTLGAVYTNDTKVRYYCYEAWPGVMEISWEGMPCTIYVGIIAFFMFLSLLMTAICCCQCCCSSKPNVNIQNNAFFEDGGGDSCDEAEEDDDDGVGDDDDDDDLDDDDFDDADTAPIVGGAKRRKKKLADDDSNESDSAVNSDDETVPKKNGAPKDSDEGSDDDEDDDGEFTESGDDEMGDGDGEQKVKVKKKKKLVAVAAAKALKKKRDKKENTDIKGDATDDEGDDDDESDYSDLDPTADKNADKVGGKKTKQVLAGAAAAKVIKARKNVKERKPEKKTKDAKKANAGGGDKSGNVNDGDSDTDYEGLESDGSGGGKKLATATAVGAAGGAAAAAGGNSKNAKHKGTTKTKAANAKVVKKGKVGKSGSEDASNTDKAKDGKGGDKDGSSTDKANASDGDHFSDESDSGSDGSQQERSDQTVDTAVVDMPDDKENNTDPTNENSSKAVKPAKKGFFGGLFGKKAASKTATKGKGKKETKAKDQTAASKGGGSSKGDWSDDDDGTALKAVLVGGAAGKSLYSGNNTALTGNKYGTNAASSKTTTTAFNGGAGNVGKNGNTAGGGNTRDWGGAGDSGGGGGDGSGGGPVTVVRASDSGYQHTLEDSDVPVFVNGAVLNDDGLVPTNGGPHHGRQRHSSYNRQDPYGMDPIGGLAGISGSNNAYSGGSGNNLRGGQQYGTGNANGYQDAGYRQPGRQGNPISNGRDRVNGNVQNDGSGLPGKTAGSGDANRGDGITGNRNGVNTNTEPGKRGNKYSKPEGTSGHKGPFSFLNGDNKNSNDTNGKGLANRNNRPIGTTAIKPTGNTGAGRGRPTGNAGKVGGLGGNKGTSGNNTGPFGAGGENGNRNAIPNTGPNDSSVVDNTHEPNAADIGGGADTVNPGFYDDDPVFGGAGGGSGRQGNGIYNNGPKGMPKGKTNVGPSTTAVGKGPNTNNAGRGNNGANGSVTQPGNTGKAGNSGNNGNAPADTGKHTGNPAPNVGNSGSNTGEAGNGPHGGSPTPKGPKAALPNNRIRKYSEPATGPSGPTVPGKDRINANDAGRRRSLEDGENGHKPALPGKRVAFNVGNQRRPSVGRGRGSNNAPSLPNTRGDLHRSGARPGAGNTGRGGGGGTSNGNTHDDTFDSEIELDHFPGMGPSTTKPADRRNSRNNPAWVSGPAATGKDKGSNTRTQTQVQPLRNRGFTEVEPVLGSDRLGKKFPFLNLDKAKAKSKDGAEKPGGTGNAENKPGTSGAIPKNKSDSNLVHTGNHGDPSRQFPDLPNTLLKGAEGGKSKSMNDLSEATRDTVFYGFGVGRWRLMATKWLNKWKMRRRPVKTARADWA